jgi:predicted PurR-regulated permease PerM
LLGIEFSYLFAFFAAVATLIPFFGALIGALPAVIAAFLVSPLTPLWVILLFVGLQLLENYIIEPFVMKEQIDLHPGLVIISIIAGSAAFGVIGLILSVPLAAVLQELLRYFLFEKKESGKRSS